MRMTKAVLPHMRAQKSGRVINMSSVGGFAPQPFMASYVASKHAVEGYSESVDHEVREHGVRVLLIEPFNTSTSFEASVVRGENPLPVYERGRRTFEAILAEGMETGTDPAVIAKVMTDPTITQRLSESGFEPQTSTPDQFAAYMKSEIAKWAKVIHESNISLD